MEKSELIQLEAILATFKSIEKGRSNYPTSLAMDRLTYDLAKLVKAIAERAYHADLEKPRYKTWEAIMDLCEALMSLPSLE